MMSVLLRYQKVIVLGLLPMLFYFLTEAQSYARQSQHKDTPVTNVRWMQRGDVIIINYDLIGSPQDEYDVSIVVRQKNDSTFAAVPFSIHGDIGPGHHAGLNKGIRWQYKRDFPQGFRGPYYFEINARMLSKPGYALYYYVIGGSALAAAGLIALIASLHQGGQSATPELPVPPGRP